MPMTAVVKLQKMPKRNGLQVFKISRAEALAGGEAGKIQAYKDAAQAYADDGDLQTAKAVYIEAMQKADGISDATEKNEAITDAYTAYQQAQENYFANTGYSSDEQNLVASYAEVSSSGNYGWSRTSCCMRIQESVINSKPGQVAERLPKPMLRRIISHSLQLMAVSVSMRRTGSSTTLIWANWKTCSCGIG